MGGLRGCWGLEVVLEATEAKISKSSSFITFHNRIFVVLSFEVVWPRRPRRPRKELGEYFQRLHFWNQFVPLIKMHYRVRYSLDFDLKIRSGQVCMPLGAGGQMGQSPTIFWQISYLTLFQSGKTDYTHHCISTLGPPGFSDLPMAL